MLNILSNTFLNTLKNNSKKECENQINYGIIPNSRDGYNFDKTAIKVKSLLNDEFMQRPVDSNVAIVWYHKGLASHVGFSIDDKPDGFALFSHTPEPNSLQKSIERRIKGIKGGCSAITIQYLKISLAQKRKIEQILDMEHFPCFTCMHAVSRILAKTTNIQIPALINQIPDTSLNYLKKLQQGGMKTLLEQRTFGKQGIILNNKKFCDIANRIIVACNIGCFISAFFKSNLFIFSIATLMVLYKIHLIMHSNMSNQTNRS